MRSTQRDSEGETRREKIRKDERGRTYISNLVQYRVVPGWN